MNAQTATSNPTTPPVVEHARRLHLVKPPGSGVWAHDVPGLLDPTNPDDEDGYTYPTHDELMAAQADLERRFEIVCQQIEARGGTRPRIMNMATGPKAKTQNSPRMAFDTVYKRRDDLTDHELHLCVILFAWMDTSTGIAELGQRKIAKYNFPKARIVETYTSLEKKGLIRVEEQSGTLPLRYISLCSFVGEDGGNGRPARDGNGDEWLQRARGRHANPTPKSSQRARGEHTKEIPADALRADPEDLACSFQEPACSETAPSVPVAGTIPLVPLLGPLTTSSSSSAAPPENDEEEEEDVEGSQKFNEDALAAYAALYAALKAEKDPVRYRRAIITNALKRDPLVDTVLDDLEEYHELYPTLTPKQVAQVLIDLYEHGPTYQSAALAPTNGQHTHTTPGHLRAVASKPRPAQPYQCPFCDNLHLVGDDCDTPQDDDVEDAEIVEEPPSSAPTTYLEDLKDLVAKPLSRHLG